MTQLPIHIDILESDAQLEKLMLLEVAKTLNSKIPPMMGRISDKLRSATYHFLKTGDTYNSLAYGDLAYHFGIPGAGRVQRIDNILLAVANGMEIEYVPLRLRARSFKGGITFKVLQNNLSEVIDLVEGEVVTERGEILQWLRWLLTYGDRVIVREYEIHLIGGRGRSGGGIMVKNDASAWRVPPKFAGTIRKNWLTRALKDNSTAYLSIIESIVKTELQRI